MSNLIPQQIEILSRRAGLCYLTSLAAPLVGYIVGSHSDRMGQRQGFFRRSALAGFVGWQDCSLNSGVDAAPYQ